MKSNIFGIPVDDRSPKLVLEQIKKGLKSRAKFVHVVSLNPENLVVANGDPEFHEIVTEAQIRINDGIGTVLAIQILNGVKVPRLTGVDLMQQLVNWSGGESLRVLLIGGKGNLAEVLANCYNQGYSASKFIGVSGYKDIKNPSSEETNHLLSIVADLRPHLIFLAFGSPDQEKWVYRNRASLQGVTCIGVGGAFDFLGGNVKRAPSVIRSLGLEWLFRLIRQPWRWRRQLRLIQFMQSVLGERMKVNRRVA